MASSRWLIQMSSEAFFEQDQTGDGRGRNNCVAQDRDELAQQAPRGGLRQAALAQWGESSNASTSGSSNRIIKR